MGLIGWIYLSEIVDSVSLISLILFIILLFFCIVGYCAASDNDLKDEGKKLLKRFSVGCFVSMFIFVVTPSQKAVYAMMAISFGQKAIESKEFQVLHEKAFRLLEIKIDEVLEGKDK